MKTFLGIGAIVLTVGYYLHTKKGADSILFFLLLLCVIGAILIKHPSYQDYMILFRKRMNGMIKSDIALSAEVEALEKQKTVKYTFIIGAGILSWMLFA